MMCNMLWTVYSAFRNDFAIFIVSVTAVGVAIFQAIVVFWCRVDSPMDLSFLLFLFSSRPVEEKGRAEAEKVSTKPNFPSRPKICIASSPYF